MAPVPSPPGTVPFWKLIGGAALHGVVPVYGVALGVDGWLHVAGGAQAWLAQVPGFSLWFLGVYGGIGAGATALAAVLEPRRPRPVAIPDFVGNPLRDALAQGRGAFGPQADAALDRIAALRPDAGDAGAVRMVRDLAAMVSAGRAAMQQGGDHAEMRAITAQAIGRIADELDTLVGGQARDDARDRARIMATYVEQRYGPDGI